MKSRVTTPKGGNAINLKGTIKSNFDSMIPLFTKSVPFSEQTLCELIDKTKDSHNKIIVGFGVILGTKRWKAICIHAINLLDGRIPEKETFSVGLKDSWPKALSHLRPVRDVILGVDYTAIERRESYRFVLTLCKLNAVCSDNSDLDINNIQKTFVINKELEEEFNSYLKLRLSQEDCNANLEELIVDRPVYGPANGPNGVPKLQSATAESIALLSGKLGKPFREYCELSGNSNYLGYVEDYSSRNNPGDAGKLKSDKIILRKLTSIADKGNKSRTVAICDFWTQTLLGPLERAEEKHLRKNFSRNSAFYSHSEGFNKVLAEYDETWKSIDASQWTDNFPSRLQYLYLKLRYGKRLAYAWRELVVDCPWNIGNSDHTIKYGKGQGMGTKGSFMIASVTDHYFIQFLSEKCYKKVVPYNKVGDDLVISDVDNIYMDYYPKIGVEINSFKTKLSTPNGKFIEYVSRTGWDNHDVSQISPNLVASVHRQPLLFPVLIEHVKGRCPSFTSADAFELVSKSNMKAEEVQRILKVCTLYQKLTGIEIVTIPDGLDHGFVSNITVINCLFRLIDKLDQSIEGLNQQLMEKSATKTRERAETLVNQFGVSDLDLFRFSTEAKLELSDIQLLLITDSELKSRREEQDQLSWSGISPVPSDLKLGRDLLIHNHEFSNMIIDSIILADSKRLSIKLIDEYNPKSTKNIKALAQFLKTLNRTLKEELESPLSEDLQFPEEYLSTYTRRELNRMIPFAFLV
jgi:hypothetical protein